MADIFEILKEKLAAKSEKVGGGAYIGKGGLVQMDMEF